MRTTTPLSGPVVTYDVNPEGQRLRKYDTSGTSTWFAPDLGGTLQAEDINGTWQDYVWLNGRLVAVVKGGQIDQVHSDQTGRPETITDASQDILWRARDWAWDRSVLTNVWGSFNLGFPGQYYDSEVNKWYNGHRDYDAVLARYIESDPIGLAGGVNTYAYVGNNPVSNIDPLGLCPKCTRFQQLAAEGAARLNTMSDDASKLAIGAGALAVGAAALEIPSGGLDTPVTAALAATSAGLGGISTGSGVTAAAFNTYEASSFFRVTQK
jgi:RHS repeat-associated protein